ncbi:response regulator [Paenibacillus doosanensis]|uniref:Transcriptional regulatory protein YehT n=1 Tax=Paenibacillus konkukensis TaxID=2020716 RepID=A0ABY4RRT1_9BACL|nr:MULTISPECIES: response regulator [Paenibacillus]MCS7459669.1 response regulator [Paenibacillus doosanensis]UQZ84670.1 Transcriptional regulatory protein YehT [Paenibacillus konkukensis]
MKGRGRKLFSVVIVEDEKPILDLMKHIISQNGFYSIVGVFTNPAEALAQWESLRPDVAFLDVEIPKMSGLELAGKINEISDQTEIIFTTAYKQYALDAFGVNAFDYLLKPVTPAAIDKVAQRLAKKRGLLQTGEMKRSVSIQCFGGFEVVNADGIPVRWPTRKTEELFAYFLCHPGQILNKWHLADLLWGDMDEERASHNLHNTIYRLKKILREHEIEMVIQKKNTGYMLHTGTYLYDLLEFQQYGDGCLKEGEANPLMERLYSMYKGPLFDKKGYFWKSRMEEAYGELYIAFVRALVKRDLSAGDLKQAEKRIQACLYNYPLHEEINQEMVELYLRLGRTDRAEKHYKRFKAAYIQELGIEPPYLLKDRLADAWNQKT